jgi:uracil-DNA glycosylase family 4
MSEIPTLIGEDEGEVEVVAEANTPPLNVRTTRRIGDKLWVAGEGTRPNRVMFIASSVTEEEAAETQTMIYGRGIRQKPRYLKGPAGAIFKDTADQVGIQLKNCYYTALVKYLLPKQERAKPKRQDIQWCQQALLNEIAEVKPEIIVCLGKPVFDLLWDSKIKIPLQDIHGAWFYSEAFKCRLFPMDDVYKPVFKPEFVEKNLVELREVKKMLDRIDGIGLPEVIRHYRTVENVSQLAEMVGMWDTHQRMVQSVDCEWEGNNHVNGKLRSIQFAWDIGHGAYVKFRDENQQYVFDTDYGTAGGIMGCWLNKPEVKYVGHHFSADAPWMDKWLHLDWYNKCIMDTEFGQQCIDEYESLGLERVSVRYTDCGRYDIQLMLWAKANKALIQDGYGKVPDEIIIPYGIYDVDVVYRAYPYIVQELARQNLLEYFYGIFLPFVTNVFTQFALTGLPMNRAQMDELRELYNFSQDQMQVELQKHICEEADQFLLARLMQVDSNQGALNFGNILEHLNAGQVDEAFAVFKAAVGVDNLNKLQPIFDHRVVAPRFNIRSTGHMRRWLFEVKNLEPIKTTARKEQGMPSMPWSKVPIGREHEFSPSTDKQTLQILGESDKLIGELLELNAVGNIVKGLLKEPVIDDETGEITKENGLHFWLCDDDRVHGQLSTTETGRPRSWKPNTLNWSSFVNKKISDGIEKLMLRLQVDGKLHDRYLKYTKKDSVPSIRSCVDASTVQPLPGSEGWCLVESDYKTAEVRGLAYISGDPAMIKMFEEPDTQFGLLRIGNSGSDDDFLSIRLNYASDCGINPEGQDHRVIMHEVYMDKKTKELVFKPVTLERLERNPDNSLRHPDFDFHWNLAEMVNHKPREFMAKKVERDAGKVGNFQSAYGSVPDTLERKIEADTGSKPPEGTGRALLDALDKRQPVAMGFLKSMEEIPRNPGYYRAASGRVRHFSLHPENLYQISSRTQRGMVSALGRECRNFPMQESVAATSAKAGNNLLEYFRNNNMRALPMVILYDSVVTLCPIEERFIVADLHQRYMSDENTWLYGDRKLQYPIDTEFNLAWSAKPSKDIKTKLYDRSWANDPSVIK